MSGGYKTWGSTEVPTASIFNTHIRDQVVMRFATKAERDSVLTSPQNGMLCYCADTGELYSRSSGTVWRSFNPRIFWVTADKFANDTVSIEDIPGLTIPVEASSTYLLDLSIGFMSSTGLNDIRFGWSAPSGVGGNWYLAGMDQTTGSTSTTYPDQFRGDLTWGTELALGTSSLGRSFAQGRGYLTTSTTPGNMTFRVAEGFAQAGATWAMVTAGSNIRIRKIA